MPIEMSIARAAAQAFLPSMVSRGLSSRQIMSVLQRTTGGYQRQLLLADIRKIKGLAALEHLARRAVPDEMYPQTRLHETFLRRPRNYYIKFETEMYDPVTGEISTKFFSMYTDTADSPEGWFNQLMKQEGWTDSAGGMQVLGFKMFYAGHQSEYPY